MKNFCCLPSGKPCAGAAAPAGQMVCVCVCVCLTGCVGVPVGEEKYTGFWTKWQKISEKTFINKGLLRGCPGKTFYAGQERTNTNIESGDTIRHPHKDLTGPPGPPQTLRAARPQTGVVRSPGMGFFQMSLSPRLAWPSFQCVSGQAQSRWCV